MIPAQTTAKKHFSVGWAVIAVLSLLLVGSNLCWWRVNQAPQAHDESIHLDSALDYARLLGRSPLAAAAAFLTKDAYYPPLVPFLAGFFGKDSAHLLRAMAFFQVLLIIAVFVYARRSYGEPAAVLAAGLTAILPEVYRQGHWFMLDVPLTAMVFLCLALLDASEDFHRRRVGMGLGICVGLALLVKWSLVVYLALPLWLAWRGARRDRERRRNFFVAVLAAMLVCGPWYLWNLLPLGRDLVFFGIKGGGEQGQPSIFTWASFSTYFRALPDLAGPVLIPALAGIALGFRDPKIRKNLWLFLVPVLAFTFIHNKKFRYIVPTLPFLAVLASSLILKIRESRRAVLGLFLAAVCAGHYALATLPAPFSWPYPSRPIPGNWHLEELLSAVEKDHSGQPGEAWLAVVPDYVRMNNLTLGYLCHEHHPGIRISGIFNFPLFAQYVLVKTGDQGSIVSGLDQRLEINRNALDPNSEFSRTYGKLRDFRLPDGSEGILFARQKVIAVRDGEFDADLKKNFDSLLSKYLKGAQGFRWGIHRRPGQAWVDSLEAGFGGGLAGDFQHKPAGLRLGKTRLVLHDLLVDPAALHRGELKLMSLGSVEIQSLEVAQEEVSAFLQSQTRDLDGVGISFFGGQVSARARFRDIPLLASVRLENRDLAHPNLWFRVEALRAGFVPLPCWLINFLAKDFNPLLKNVNTPVRLDFHRLDIDKGLLKIS
jgi:hypothetical protein